MLKTTVLEHTTDYTNADEDMVNKDNDTCTEMYIWKWLEQLNRLAFQIATIKWFKTNLDRILFPKLWLLQR